MKNKNCLLFYWQLFVKKKKNIRTFITFDCESCSSESILFNLALLFSKDDDIHYRKKYVRFIKLYNSIFCHEIPRVLSKFYDKKILSDPNENKQPTEKLNS